MARPKGLQINSALIRQERERQNMSAVGLARYTRTIARAAQRARGETETDPGLTARTIFNAENGKRASARTARLISWALGLPYLFVVHHEAHDIAEHLAREGLRPEPPTLPLDGCARHSDTLARDLLSGRRHACIYGAGSTGKTTLARHIAQRDDIRAHYRHGVLWLGNGPALRQRRYQVLMNQIARALDFTHQLPSAIDHSPETIRQRFHYCLSRGSVLLVLDDLRDEEALRWLVPESGGTGVLVTTGDESLAQSFAPAIVRLRDAYAPEPRPLLRRYTPSEHRAADLAMV